MIELSPHINEGRFVFVTVSTPLDTKTQYVLHFHEKEGHTYVIHCELADQMDLDYSGLWSWITLQNVTDLHATGITASFSTALARANISCNVVAAYHHDHLFVPMEQAEEAMKILKLIKL